MTSQGFTTECVQARNQYAAKMITRMLPIFFFFGQLWFMRRKKMAESMAKILVLPQIYHGDKLGQWSMGHTMREKYTILKTFHSQI